MTIDYQVIEDYDELDLMAKRMRRLAKIVPFNPVSIAKHQKAGADSPDLAKHTRHLIVGFEDRTYWLRVIFTRDIIPMTEREMYHFHLSETRSQKVPDSLAKRLADVFLPGKKRTMRAPNSHQFFKMAN